VEAGTILALFPPALPPPRLRFTDSPRNLWEIIGDTLRIYFKGFPQFLALALLVAIPLLG
jgi:hypothetical protein